MKPRIAPKPALMLDDSPGDVYRISRALRLFGGVDVKYFTSIPAWERSFGAHFNPTIHGAYDELCQKVAIELKDYSSVVCDNNFEAAGYPDNGAQGLPYLTGVMSDSIKLLPPEERPLVICFAPSSSELVKGKQKELWEKHGIIAFDKFYEASFIGITARIAQEKGRGFSREQILHDIFGFNHEEIYDDTAAAQFGRELRCDYLENDELFGSPEIIAGPAIGMDWNVLTKELAQRLDIPEKDFLARIEGTVGSSEEGTGYPPHLRV